MESKTVNTSLWGPDANCGPDFGKDGGGAPAAAAAPAQPAPITAEDIAKAVQAGVDAALSKARADAEAKAKADRTPAAAVAAPIVEEAKGAPAFHPNRKAIQTNAEADTHQGRGLNFGKALHALAFCLHDKSGIRPEEAADLLGYKDIAVGMANRRKAMGPNSLAGGGALIAPEWSSEIIPLLTPQMVTRRAGVRSQPINAEMAIPKITSGTTAVWIGAGEKITASAMAFGQLKLIAHKLGVFLGFPNEWFRQAIVGVDALVRDDFLRSASLKEDVTYLRGAGSANTPKGIRYQVNSSNVDAIVGTTTDNKLADLEEQVGMVEDNDVPLEGCCWFGNPRTKRHFSMLRNTDNQFIFRDELKGPNPTLMGFPFYATSQIPKNLGSGSNETELYFGNPAMALIGDGLGISLASSDSASWTDEDGASNDAFQQDQTVMRLILERDFLLRYDKAFAVRTGVTY